MFTSRNGRYQFITGVEFNRKAATQGAHHVIQAITSEGLAQGPYVAVRVKFEPATLLMQGTELTTKPP